MIRKYNPDKDIAMTRTEVRDFDAWAINSAGISGVVLMENAAIGCCGRIIEKLTDGKKNKVCIICGTGNNGGDGFAIARQLVNQGFDVSVLVCGDTEKIKGDAKINYCLLSLLKIKVETLNPGSANLHQTLAEYTADTDLLVDAIFGTGLSGELRSDYKNLISAINSLGLKVVAVDIPSGLDCDTGTPLPDAVIATDTVTFVAAKKGFTNLSSHKYTGNIYIASIGIEPNAKP